MDVPFIIFAMARRKHTHKALKTLFLIIFILIAVAILFDCISTRQEQSKLEPAQPVAAGEIPEGVEIPVCALEHKAPDHERRDFNHYSICYREQYEQCEWSAYSLTKEQLENRVNRTDDFRPDPKISTGSADLNDYKKSGYDRGHLTPAADREFSKEAVSETFYMSNMSPQYPAFNREIWQYLEHQVREWAKAFGKVYVVSGPVLEKPASQYESIGKNKVTIPQYYYKVILAKKDQKIISIGFIISNTKHKDEFWNYATTVDEVERRTGIDFFALLDDETENATEANCDISLWKTN